MPPDPPDREASVRARGDGRARPTAYAAAVGLVALVTSVGALARGHLGEPDLVLLYLLAVVIAAARFGRGPSLLAAALSVLAFDFFFIPPNFTFLVAEKRYVLTFAIMLAVSLVTRSEERRVGGERRSRGSLSRDGRTVQRARDESAA